MANAGARVREGVFDPEVDTTIFTTHQSWCAYLSRRRVLDSAHVGCLNRDHCVSGTARSIARGHGLFSPRG